MVRGGVRASHRHLAPIEKIKVLLSLWPPDATTQYVDQLVGGAPTQVDYLYFSWRAALTARFDVFHLHWPEMTIRADNTWRAFVRRRALDLFLLRCRLQSIPIVRTLHNVGPHEQGSPAEERSLRKYDKATTLFVKLNESTPVRDGSLSVTVPHGHYRSRFDALPRPAQVPGRVLYFGIVRPYKGVLDLVSAFAQVPGDDLSLRIVGAPSPGQAELVTEASAHDPRISLDLRYVEDSELVAEIAEAQLVVFPYRQMHNSGALLAALSVDRPSLAPRTPANELLAEEVGEGWILLYDTLDSEVLREAFESVSGGRPGRPDLSRREWHDIGVQHYRAYLAALDGKQAADASSGRSGA